MVKNALGRAPLATLAGLAPHYLLFYALGTPLWTDTIAEWIMARTPSAWAVFLLETLGPWAKPFAMTGGLATLGFALFVAASMRARWAVALAVAVAAFALGWWFDYRSPSGQLSFWAPALLVLTAPPRLGRVRPAPPRTAMMPRREAIATIAGTAAVAVESFARNEVQSRRAVVPVEIAPFHPPAETFSPDLVRKAVTPTPAFYGMSKNTVDPVLHPRDWRLRVTVDGRLLREAAYHELLAMPRTDRYVTLRCISNTLRSDLMGTALWSGLRLHELVRRDSLPEGIREVAIIGVDGHGDSLPVEFAFSEQVLLALGMNGKTLNRTHGFPLRLLCPRFYGFKNVKWIGEIAFASQPYFGTWPKMGYTKNPVIHTASHIDRVIPRDGQLHAGGVSFAGDRGIRQVLVRADEGEWIAAELEPPLSGYTWTRWRAVLPAASARAVEARAQDGQGRWQEEMEGPLFPDGVKGPTIKRLT